MEIINSLKEMQQKVLNLKKENQEIGFVPTMGYFHEGHLSLMERAKLENDILIVSIFVNPLQFGPDEDYDHYPRDSKRDYQLAEELGVDIIFAPSVEEMYPQELSLTLQVKERNDVLCARSRPTHFDGVVTVLAKLFNIILPNRVYFGMKDAQQVAVVNGLIHDLNFPTQLIGLPTVRENSGLAKSSRNVNLSDAEKIEAEWLYKSLIQAKDMINAGETDPDRIIGQIKNLLENHTNGEIDYVEILAFPSLNSIKMIDTLIIIAVAVKFEKARLIDNILINKDGQVVDVFVQGRE